jgi:serine/threonine protein kinase
MTKMDEQSIFLAVLEKTTSAERTAFLSEACEGNAVLQQRIEALLQRHDDAGSFLEHLPTELVGTAVMSSIKQEEDETPQDDGRNMAFERSEDSPLDFLRPSNKVGCLGTIGQYEINAIVGRGGMGLVLRAHDTKLQRTVAVKVLAPELAANAAAKQRFLREARAAAAVTHPHVVTIHAVDDDRVPYLVMEMVDGMTLRQKLNAVGMLGVKEILRIGSQIGHGLAAAHKQGLIHRDVKPANILLENGVERVKITDFGLARAVNDASVTRTGELAGTPQYMSPEQAQGEPVDHRTDLFSLGSVLYTMCTGRAPFRGDNPIAVIRRVVDDTPRTIREINDEIPEWLCAIIVKLLQKNPADRYQTAAEVAMLLEQHLAQVQQRISTPAVTEPKSPMPNNSGESALQKSVSVGSRVGQRLVAHGTWRNVMLAIGGIAVVALLAVIIAKTTNKNGATVDGVVPNGSNVEIANANDTNDKLAPGESPVAVNQAVPQLSPASAGTDRRAAEWVLSIGGNIHVTQKDKEWRIAVAGNLPQAAFELTAVDLSRNQTVSDGELAKLKDCKNLTKLVLDGTLVSNAGLVYLKDFKNLSILGVGDTIVSDSGLAHLKDCKNLWGLWLYGTRVGDPGLAGTIKELPNIRFIHLSNSRVSDKG